MQVDNIHWIVVEDSSRKSAFVTSLLARMPFPCKHLFALSSFAERKTRTRGASQRNAGLSQLLKEPIGDGDVIYFADDDNTYDVRLFDDIRKTRRVGVFPVGFMKPLPFTTPVVRDGVVVDFLDHWPAKRTFMVDMAGFSVNIGFWRQRGSPLFVARALGYLEDDFLKSLNITLKDLEPLAANCSQLLVWHTKTTSVKKRKSTLDKAAANFSNTNVIRLLNQV